MEVSKSKAKRLERQKEVAAKKRKNIVSKIIWAVVIVALVACVAFFAGLSIYKKSKITKSISDYSQGLTDEGLVSGVNVSDYLTLCDIDNLVIPLSEVSATDEEIQSDIDSALSSHPYVNDDAALEVKDGDTVNIDYVGTIDGVAFDGGSAEGSNLVIGSGSFIDTFELQLVGSHPGDDVLVKVTFPEDYSNTDLAGKPAEFSVHVNGLQLTPDFDDAFVEEYLSDVAASADEYREYIANNYYDSHLTEYLSNYIIDESEVTSYPKSYVKVLKGITKFNDESNLAYYNNMFSSYGLQTYDTVWAMRDVESEEAYEEELVTRAEETCKQVLCYQALFDKFNLTVDFDSYMSDLDAENGEGTADSMLETYGKGYLMQANMAEAVIDYLKANVKVQ